MKKISIFIICIICINNIFADTVNNIVEFFSFGCPHCYKTEPELQKILSSNRNIKYVPVVIVENAPQEAVSAIYTACQLKGMGWQFRNAYFNAVFQEGYPAYSPNTVTYVLNKIGVKLQDAVSIAQSETVKSKLEFDKSLMQRYQVSSTPTFIINGTTILQGDSALNSLGVN